MTFVYTVALWSKLRLVCERKFLYLMPMSRTFSATALKTTLYNCAADFSLLNLPKGKSLGRSKPATNS
jgi:hypothetical protein